MGHNRCHGMRGGGVGWGEGYDNLHKAQEKTADLRLQICILCAFPGEFTLNETTGLVSIARGLDYENSSSFVLKVEADSIQVVSSNFRVPSKSEY